MQQSKRFILVSLFAGITISALGNNLVCLIDHFSESGEWAPLAYSAALLIFLVKYFVDDLTDENTRQNGKTKRCQLILLVLAWVFFLLAALFLKNILISVVFWLAGLFFVTIFMLKYPPTKGSNVRKCSCPVSGYMTQNIILFFLLFLLLLPNLGLLLSSQLQTSMNSLDILCNLSWQQAWSLVLFLITIIFLFCSATGNNTTGDN